VIPGPSNAKRKVLLVEDSPGDARLMREYLADPAGSSFQLEHASTLQAGLERLAQGIRTDPWGVH